MPTYVKYMVPVLVEVDIDQGVVVSVHVDDERAEGPVDVLAVDTGGLSGQDAHRAREISESQDWPAWELGP